MPPLVALLLTAAAVAVALIADSRRKPRGSLALWVPQIWLLIIASRPLAVWFTPESVRWDAAIVDGSALDRNTLSVLIVIAAVVLVKRQLAWGQWLRANPWVFVFFLYCGLSILWSDFPAVAFKRWVRALGSVTMVLVVLSEDNPAAATVALVRRCAYVLIPFSVVLIKYFRLYGVGYNPWNGEQSLAGVTTDKNALGRLCLVAVLFLLWELVTRAKNEASRASLLNRLIGMTVFALAIWLLDASKSATSLATLLLGCGVLVGLGMSPVKKSAKYLGTILVVATIAVLLVTLTTPIAEVIVTSLGRDMTFTDRTFVWADLIGMGTNPLVGVGYDSFWLGERLETFMRVHFVNEAHNGYLEVYLELGIVGLLLFVGILLGVFRAATQAMLSDSEYGRLRMAFLAVFVTYNITEAGYKVTTLMFFMLLLVGMNSPRLSQARAPVHAGVQKARPNRRSSFRLPGPHAPSPFAQRRRV